MSSLAKLQWQCRRGTKELDLLLQHYLQTQYSQSTSEEKALFVELLSLEDNQLSAYLLNKDQPSSKKLNYLIITILKNTSPLNLTSLIRLP